MSIQDDITASEQELALLFEGALAGPLGPIRSEVDNSRRALEALENKVDGLQASLQWLCDDQKDAVEALISKCRDSVLSAQVEHTAHLCSQLESHAVERSMWLAAKLDEATSKHLQALLDWKDSLDHQVLALQAGVIAADQQLQDVSSHLHMQTQALQGLQDAGNALSGLSHESRSQQEESFRSMHTLIQSELRTVRRMLAAAVVLALGTLATTVASHWPWPLG